MMSRRSSFTAAGTISWCLTPSLTPQAIPWWFPPEHLDRLSKLPAETLAEMTELTQHLEAVLFDVYHPDGVNLGMNIGKAAGAGVAGHVHMHILPRWVADANFMTTVGETRVLPELLSQTYTRLKQAF